jgi:hypothetical protein
MASATASAPHADRCQHAVLDALAIFHGGLEIPGRGARRHFPVLALECQHFLGPALLDDLPVLLERLAVGLVDRIMLVRQGPGHAMGLLRHDVDPAPLIAAGEAGAGPPAGHVIEHRDVLGDADRVGGRQHDPELADTDAFGLHREIEVEQHGVVGKLETLDMKVVLGEADRVVAEVIGEFDELGQLFQHALVKLRPRCRHAGLDLGARADARQAKYRCFHLLPPLKCC